MCCCVCLLTLFPWRFFPPVTPFQTFPTAVSLPQPCTHPQPHSAAVPSRPFGCIVCVLNIVWCGLLLRQHSHAFLIYLFFYPTRPYYPTIIWDLTFPYSGPVVIGSWCPLCCVVVLLKAPFNFYLTFPIPFTQKIFPLYFIIDRQWINEWNNYIIGSHW